MRCMRHRVCFDIHELQADTGCIPSKSHKQGEDQCIQESLPRQLPRF